MEGKGKISFTSFLEELEANTVRNNLSVKGKYDYKLLAAALRSNTSLTKLDLSPGSTTVGRKRKIPLNDVIILAEALKANQGLVSLSFAYNHIGHDGAAHVSEALKLNQKIVDVNLADNKLGPDGAEHVAQMLAQRCSLAELCLDHNSIGDNGCIPLANALKVNESLVELNLNSNKITQVGMGHLASAIKVNRVLMKVMLSNNNIGPDGVKTLAEALQINKSIVEVELIANNLGNRSAKSIEALLNESTCLTYLYISENDFGDQCAKNIANALKSNKTLVRLDLSSNKFGHAAAKQFGEALIANNKLTYLSLENNKLGNVGAKHLSKSLRLNTGLVELNLCRNSIGNSGASDLATGLSRNTSLVKLMIDGSKVNKSTRTKIDAILSKNEAKRHATFLEVLNSDKKISWNRSKLMFVGQGKTGKSSTVRSLLGQAHEARWISTIGANVQEYSTLRHRPGWEAADFNNDYTSQFASRIMLRDQRLKQENKASTTKKENFSLQSAAYNAGQNVKLSVLNNVNRIRQTNRKDKSSSSNSSSNSSRRDKRKKNKSSSGQSKSNKSKRMRAKNITLWDESGISLSSNQKKLIVRDFGENLLIDAQREEDRVRLSLWDFGGQAVFYSMHHIFLTKSGVYIIVFDMREIESAEAISYLSFWLRSIRTHAPAAALIMVGTFLGDIKSKDGVELVNEKLKELTKASSSQLVRNTSEGLDFFPVDNSYSLGIKKLRKVIESVVRDEKSISYEVSLKWISLLDEILKQGKDGKTYLKLSTIRELAEPLGFHNKGEQEEALRLFHERGMLIHLDSTENLKDIIIVKPQWLIDALSRVIRDGNIHKFNKEDYEKAGLVNDLSRMFQDGLASRKLLEFIWEKTNQVDFFLDFMKDTVLLCDWDFSHEAQFLIPSLLNKTYEDSAETTGLQCVFDFSASYLPAGLFQRLICSCIAYVTSENNIKQKEIKKPELYNNFAVIGLTPDLTVYFQEDSDFQYIVMTVKKKCNAADGLTIVRPMLSELNDHVLGGKLSWQTYLQDTASGELIEYRKALQISLKPWFDLNLHHVDIRNE